MTVGVFRDDAVNRVLSITGDLGLTAAQLHGDESPDVTAAVAARVETVIKVLAPHDPAVRSVADDPLGVAHGIGLLIRGAPRQERFIAR